MAWMRGDQRRLPDSLEYLARGDTGLPTLPWSPCRRLCPRRFLGWVEVPAGEFRGHWCGVGDCRTCRVRRCLDVKSLGTYLISLGSITTSEELRDYAASLWWVLKVMNGSHRPTELTAAELALLRVTKIRIEEDGFLSGIQEEVAAVLVALSGLELRAFSPFPFSGPLLNPRPVDVGAAVIVGAATSDPRAHFGVERTDTAEVEAEISETHQTPPLVGNDQLDGEQSHRTVKVTLSELQGEGGTGPARTFAEKAPIGPAGADDDRERGDRVGDDITDDLYVFEVGEWWCGQEAGYKPLIGYRLGQSRLRISVKRSSTLAKLG